MTKIELKIDKKFRDALPKLNEDEYAALEQLLLKDGKCYDPLKVWASKGVLLDGHNRYEICQKHDIDFEVEELEFDSDADALGWIVNYHLGRRNLTPEQVSYFRGKRYNEEKLPEGRPNGKPDQSEQVNGLTSDRLAEEENTSSATVRRDAQFATAVDTLSERLGEDARLKILSRESTVKKSQAKRLAEIAGTAPDLAERVVEGDLKFTDANALSKLTKAQRKDAERLVREDKAKTLAEAAKEIDAETNGDYDVHKDIDKFVRLREKLYKNWTRPADKSALRNFFRQMANEV